MIVYKETKAYEQQSHRPNINWVGDKAYLVEDGIELSEKNNRQLAIF